jgi:hypothetical protein
MRTQKSLLSGNTKKCLGDVIFLFFNLLVIGINVYFAKIAYHLTDHLLFLIYLLGDKGILWLAIADEEFSSF